METKKLRWYHKAIEYIIMGAAGGFIVAFSQELSSKGSISPVLAWIGLAYIALAFFITYLITVK